MKRPTTKRLLLVSVLFLVAYVGSYICWKHVALKRSRQHGIEGYYFLWSPDDNILAEDVIRVFYLPLILIDVEVFRGEGPATLPTEHLSILGIGGAAQLQS